MNASRLGVALSLALLVLPAGAQPSSAFLADAAILRREYEALHPGLYRYNTLQQMDANFAMLDAELAQATDVRSAFLALTRFTATIKCGHSYPNFYNQPDEIARSLFQGQDRLPFYVTWLDRHMIITRNFINDARLSPGTEVLTIDGRAAKDVLAALLPLARADGANETKRINEMGVRGDDRYEAFDIYYPMLFPSNSTTFHLRVRQIGGQQRILSVTAMTYQQRIAPISAMLAAGHGGNQPLWSLRFLSPDAADLRMPTWDVYDTKWDWKGFLETAFAELDARRPARLIVDLRGNEGGSDVGRVLLAHLIESPLAPQGYVRLVRFRSVEPQLLPYLTTWDPSFKSLGASAAPYDNRFFRLPQSRGDDGGASIIPATPRYRGTVYVLVDAADSSATFNFAELAQRAHLATLVGEPTGGNQRGINGGAFFFIQLPNSHIEVDIPLIGTFATEPRPDAGLVPEITVAISPEDIARGRDPVLAAALSARPVNPVQISNSSADSQSKKPGSAGGSN